MAREVDPATAEKARVAVRGYEVLTHARQARERADPVAQRSLGEEAAKAFDSAGVPARALDAKLLVCEALVASGLQKEAYRPVSPGTSRKISISKRSAASQSCRRITCPSSIRAVASACCPLIDGPRGAPRTTQVAYTSMRRKL